MADRPIGAEFQPGRHLALLGPTASGKSSLALALARRRAAAGEPIELISVDSMAVYRGMDIGTTTPSAAEREEFPHHLLDVVEPSEEFSVAEFVGAVRLALEQIESRGASAILVGGTGLYVRSVVDNLEIPGQFPGVRIELEGNDDTEQLYRRLVASDPLAASRIEPGNRRRIIRALEVTIGSGRTFSSYGPGLESYPPTPFCLIGVRIERDQLESLIRGRLADQLAAGFVEEVGGLDRATMSRTARQALGYSELADHLDGALSLDDAQRRIVERTRRFAVRQQRWFRRDPRIHWLDDADTDRRAEAALALWRPSG